MLFLTTLFFKKTLKGPTGGRTLLDNRTLATHEIASFWNFGSTIMITNDVLKLHVTTL